VAGLLRAGSDMNSDPLIFVTRLVLGTVTWMTELA
jgi:hypothetical protein